MTKKLEPKERDARILAQRIRAAQAKIAKINARIDALALAYHSRYLEGLYHSQTCPLRQAKGGMSGEYPCPCGVQAHVDRDNE